MGNYTREEILQMVEEEDRYVWGNQKYRCNRSGTSSGVE
jgi:hypothetical protein